MNVAALEEILKNFIKLEYGQLKVKLTFKEIKNVVIDANLGKVILCLIISAYYNLFKGGIITVSIEVERGQNIVNIAANSTELDIDQEGVNILSGKGKDDDLNVQNSHEYYTYYLSQKIGYSIDVRQSTEAIKYHLENRI